jgi:hypothetical protein
MHALRHPHLPRAMTFTVIAAVLAIVLTLALAKGLNDLASPAAPTGASATSPLLRAPAAGPAWALRPFTEPFSPVAVPWESARSLPAGP